MSCENKKISESLGDYYTGHFENEEMLKVESHLAVCESCRESLSTIKLLSSNMSAQSKLKHISEDLLAEYFENKKSLSNESLNTIETHLKDCDECSYDLYFLNSLDSELNSSLISEMERSPLLDFISNLALLLFRKPAVVVTYLLLILSIYPTYNWVKMDTKQETIFQLQESLRSSGESTIVSRASSESIVKINLPLYHLLEEKNYNFELLDSQNNLIDIEYISDYSNKESIVLLLNISYLKDGVYSIKVIEIDKIDKLDILENFFSFKLETKD